MSDQSKDTSDPVGAGKKKKKRKWWLTRLREKEAENMERALQKGVQAGLIGPGDTFESLRKWSPEWTTIAVFTDETTADYLLPGEVVYAYNNGGLYKHSSRFFNQDPWDFAPTWGATLLATDRRFLAIQAAVSGEPKWAEDHFYDEVYAVQEQRAHLHNNLIIWNNSERARLDGFHQKCSIWQLGKNALGAARNGNDFARVALAVLNEARSTPTGAITRPAGLAKAPAPDWSQSDGSASPSPEAPLQPTGQPPAPPNAPGARERLAEAQALLQEGAISQEEYDNVRASILSDI